MVTKQKVPSIDLAPSVTSIAMGFSNGKGSLDDECLEDSVCEPSPAVVDPGQGDKAGYGRGTAYCP